MTNSAKRISLAEWDARYEALHAAGLREASYGGPLRRHVNDGDRRLMSLKFDNSAAALRLWNFLLTEEDRLREARDSGKKLVGVLKDLGTIPVMAYAASNLVAFYPDGAWWAPCIMEFGTGMLEIADSLGIGESFCPVRAMLGAFVSGAHFPIPDLLTCSVGAICDDFSAIAQRLNHLGYPILWWEMPFRQRPDSDETTVRLPSGVPTPQSQVEDVRKELERVRDALETLSGEPLTEAALADGIRAANQIRGRLNRLRRLVYGAKMCPLPALEMLIAEMLAIHYCSDRSECGQVLDDLIAEVRLRIAAGAWGLDDDTARVFWVNPTADLRAVNLLEDCGGRVCGTDYMFSHALDEIPEELPPLEALARTALSDPMAGSAADRADRICRDMQEFGAEGLVVSRIPGASHCATEGEIIRATVAERLKLPAIELEIPPVCDNLAPALRNRIEALVETIHERRRACSTRA